MRDRLTTVSRILGKALLWLAMLAFGVLRIALLVTRRAFIAARPGAQRMLVWAKRRFDGFSERRKVRIVCAGALLLIVAGVALDTESSHATLYQCEDGACGFWAFHGKTGEGYWKNGAVATLRIVHFNRYFVTIERTDTQGPAVGLIVRYQGKRRGRHLEGAYTTVWQGHASTGGSWAADIDDATRDEAWQLAAAAQNKGDPIDRLHWLMAGAEMGDPRARNDLGICYAAGYTVAVDYARARQLLEQSMNAGNKEAAANLARIYSQGLGVPKDQARADALNRRSGFSASAPAATAQGGFFGLLDTAARQAGEVQNARQTSPQAGKRTLSDILYGIISKRAQMEAAEQAECEKSAECQARMREEQRLQDNEIELERLRDRGTVYNPAPAY